MSRKVLITGSAGFLGSHIVDHFLQNTDWDLIGLDSFRHRGDSLRVQNSDRYKIFTCDLAAPISHRLIDQIGEIDYVLNIASDSHVDRSIENPVSFVQNNVNLALSMLEYARVVKPRQFIQFSTDEVYGPAPIGTHHAEWSTILPSNPYAASKASQEAIATSYWRTYGVPVVITNTMNLFGERQDTEKYVPMLIKKISQNETVSIHGTKDFVGTRFYIHCRNAADALLFLLETNIPKRYYDSMTPVLPDRFNIVGEREIDNLTLAKMVAQMMGKSLNYDLVDHHRTRPGHDRRYALDGRKLQKLGWKQPKNLEDSLRQTIDWTLRNPVWTK